MTSYKEVWYLFQNDATKRIRKSTEFARRPEETFLHITYGTANEADAYVRAVENELAERSAYAELKMAGWVCLIGASLGFLASFWPF